MWLKYKDDVYECLKNFMGMSDDLFIYFQLLSNRIQLLQDVHNFESIII